MKNIGYLFSEQSITGNIQENKMAVLADCLSDWGCVMGGATQPANFGKGMAKAAAYLDVLGTPESFMELAQKLEDVKT